MKNRRIIRKIGEKIEEVSQRISDELISSYNQYRGIDGKEEDITSKLEEKITDHLLKEIENSFKFYRVRGVNFDVYTYRKETEEPHIGADIAGLVEITIFDKKQSKTISKAYLAQAKIANRKRIFPYHVYYKSDNKHILKQAKKMLDITSDSFFFLYTTNGIFVVPALEIYLFNKNTIDTRFYYKKRFGSFYQEFFKCYIGDHNISTIYNKPPDLISYAEELNVKNVLYISAKMEKEEVENNHENQ